MNYERLKSLSDEKRITIPVLSSKIGMSAQGLYKSIANESLSVETLEKIAKVLSVSVLEFFEVSEFDSIFQERDKLNEENENRKNSIAFYEQKVSDLEKECEGKDKWLKDKTDLIDSLKDTLRDAYGIIYDHLGSLVYYIENEEYDKAKRYLKYPKEILSWVDKKYIDKTKARIFLTSDSINNYPETGMLVKPEDLDLFDSKSRAVRQKKTGHK